MSMLRDIFFYVLGVIIGLVLVKVKQNFMSYRDASLEHMIKKFNIPRNKIYKTYEVEVANAA